MGQHMILIAWPKNGKLLLCAPGANTDWNVLDTDGCLWGSAQYGIQHWEL